MKIFLTLCLFAFGLTAVKTCHAAPDWSQVRYATAGETLHIRTLQGRKVKCKLTSATDDSLTCFGSSKVGPLNFSRSEIRTIWRHRGWRSAVASAGLGFAGAAVGSALSANQIWYNDPGKSTLIVATLTMLGVLTVDLCPETIYRNSPPAPQSKVPGKNNHLGPVP